MAGKLTDRVIVPCTPEQKQRWKDVLPFTQYTKLAEFIRELTDTFAIAALQEGKQVAVQIVDIDPDVEDEDLNSPVVYV